MKYSFALLLLLVLARCGLLENSDLPDVRLEADRIAYQPGQDLVLALMNFSGRTFTVSGDLCSALLQRREKTTWKPIPRDGVCVDVGVVLKFGGAVVSRRKLDDTLLAGSYRYLYELSDSEGGERYWRFERIELYTRVFEVSK